VMCRPCSARRSGELDLRHAAARSPLWLNRRLVTEGNPNRASFPWHQEHPLVRSKDDLFSDDDWKLDRPMAAGVGP